MQLTFALPSDGVLIPEKGASVKVGDPLITYHSSELKIFDIADALSIKPDNLFNFLTIVVGQQVSPGTVLAEKKSFIGKKRAESDIEGVVDRIQLDTGEIIVRFGSQATGKEKASWFSGTIHAINPDKNTFTVSFKEGHEYPLTSVNMDGGGELFTMDEKDFFTIGSDEIGTRVILLENPQIHIMSKLDALDAGGCLSPNEFPLSDVPSATLKSKKDFEELLHTKKKHCAFSKLDMKAVAY